MHQKTEQLWSWLEKYSNLTWDEDGGVKVYGEPLPDSNIIDLANDTARQRKHSDLKNGKRLRKRKKSVTCPSDYVWGGGGQETLGLDVR